MSKERRLYNDFYEYWEAKFLEYGYSEDYVKENFQRYREDENNEEAWPEGNMFYRRVLLAAFIAELKGAGHE